MNSIYVLAAIIVVAVIAFALGFYELYRAYKDNDS